MQGANVPMAQSGKDQSAWEDALRQKVDTSAIEKPEAEGFAWSSILTFAASVENQYALAAVNRNFSVALRSPVVWASWQDYVAMFFQVD
eukprot:Skav208326  [mRNA]  locus=scaffold897:814710:815567:- [translate_table: standard]